MKMILKDLPLAAIDCDHADRARHFDPIWAEGLAAMIAQQGLLHPITVRVVGDRFSLVAGLHRLEAHRILERESIVALISTAETDDIARLEEVMENLGRAELIALDRCQHLYELKQVWERMYPQAKQGGDHGNQYTGGKVQTLHSGNHEAEIFGFAKATALKTGLSKRAIYLAVKVWTELTPDSRARLAGTSWAEKQSEISLLSVQKPKMQADVLDKLLAQNARVHSVSDAIGLILNGVASADVDRQYLAAQKVFTKLPDPILDRLVAAQADRLITALKRVGRI